MYFWVGDNKIQLVK